MLEFMVMTLPLSRTKSAGIMLGPHVCIVTWCLLLINLTFLKATLPQNLF